MKRNAKTTDPNIPELEPHEAYMGLSFPGVQFRPGRQELPEVGRIDGIIRHDELSPFCLQKNSFHGLSNN
jgi:hypothetical protein